MGHTRTAIFKTIDEDIEILRNTLSNLQRMRTKGIDPINSSFMRKAKKDLIQHTKKDIEYMLRLRKKYNEEKP